MSRLDGRRVLVTGAARGLGAEIARCLSDAGAAVIVTDVLDDPGRAVADALPGPSLFRHLDVTNEDQWTAAVAAAGEHLGGLDGLVNNAGVLHMAPIEETSVGDVARILSVNVIGPFLGIRTVAPALRRAGGGAIVNIASIDGVAGMNSVAAYSASKFAVRGLTRSAALELGRDNIRVNAVCPAMGNPEMSQPFFDRIDVTRYMRHRPPDVMPAAANAADAARMTRFLLSDDSIGCTGSDFLVDAGYLAGHFQPGLPGF